MKKIIVVGGGAAGMMAARLYYLKRMIALERSYSLQVRGDAT